MTCFMLCVTCYLTIMDIQHLIKQKSYEKVVYVLRRHPITFVPELLRFAFLIFLPIALRLMGRNLFPDIFADAVFLPIIDLATSGYAVAILVFFFTQFIDFYLDLWVVTNDRVIDVEQFGLFSRSISELDLFRIQDVTTNVTGVFATLFNYGVVTVKTASDNKSLVFKNIHRPNTIREDLIRLSHEDRKYHYPRPNMDDNDAA